VLRAGSFAGEAFTDQSFAHVLRESLLNSPRLAREGAASQPLLHRTSQRRIAFDLQIAAFGLLLDCRQPHPDRRGGKRRDSAWSSDIEGVLTGFFRRIGRAAADDVEALTPEGQLRP
jgi:hypothetical protein